MRAVFGVLSLLVVLLVVGVLAKRQWQGATTLPSSVPSATASPGPAAPAASPQAVQRRVTDDLQRAMEQGASRNLDAQ
jgi:hypothetical protein